MPIQLIFLPFLHDKVLCSEKSFIFVLMTEYGNCVSRDWPQEPHAFCGPFSLHNKCASTSASTYMSNKCTKIVLCLSR